MNDDSRFAVCIVHYRDRAGIDRLLHNMETWTRRPSLCVIVDNSSDLPSAGADAVGTECSFPVQVVDHGSNKGYAAAVNTGLRLIESAGQALALVLTQDADLEADAVQRLLAVMETDDNVAAAAPLLAFASRRDTIFSAGGYIRADGATLHHMITEPLEAAASCGVREVDWADGACLLLRLRHAFAVGLFDERYFLYVEEVDFLYRLKRAGYRVVVDTAAIAFQEPGNNTPYFRGRNNLFFYRKFPGDFQTLGILKNVVITVREMRRLDRGFQLRTLAWYLRGLLDGFRGRMGRPPTHLLRK